MGLSRPTNAESAALVSDIAEFWAKVAGKDMEDNVVQERLQPSIAEGHGTSTVRRHAWTHRQGQFLAFIHWYRRLHRQSPAEADLAKYFRLTPPAVHSMVVKLRDLGPIAGRPGAPRSLLVLVSENELPQLESVDGPPW